MRWHHLGRLLVALVGCSPSRGNDGAVRPPPTTARPPPPPGSDPAPGPDGAAPAARLPPVNAAVDYQLGGAYPPASGVQIVVRDRRAAPVPGRYNICYVNGFQVQPDEADRWLADHADLVLRDRRGQPVIDGDWNELLLDVGAPTRRAAIAAIVGGWIAGCARAGFQAVEIDNLDSFTRAGGRLTEADAIATMRLFADAAHGHGLPVAQKNAAELVGRRVELGTDFVIAEECNRYAECATYRAGYGDQVIVIEYRRDDFERGCRDFPGLSLVLRDRALVTPGAAGYLFAGC